MKFELIEISGLKGALLGMRLPLNKDLEGAKEKSDSIYGDTVISIGDSDKKLCKNLIKGDMSAGSFGQPNSKYLRMIHAQICITAPLCFWKEFDTYKISTTSNSTSTMHRIQTYPITEDCFEKNPVTGQVSETIHIDELENLRQKYNETLDKDIKEKLWYDLIYSLPDSWLQTRMIDLNYQTLRNMLKWRSNHKQKTWRDFCQWVKETLPYADELIFNEEQH